MRLYIDYTSITDLFDLAASEGAGFSTSTKPTPC